MKSVTITKKEYSKLLEAKRKLKEVLEYSKFEKEKTKFEDSAFGILKENFGKVRSVSYVSKLRKSWRQ